jgi:two-component system, NarL family, response regulator DegU
MSGTKIMVIDSQVFFRAGLASALSSLPDFQVEERSPDNNPLSEVENKLIDVVLLEVELSRPDGPDLCRKISRLYPNTKVVVMTPNPDDDELFEVMKTSAVAYVSKNSSLAEIAGICQRAARGEYPINENLATSPKLAVDVLRQFQNTAIAIDGIAALLTKREKEILEYIANGNSNKMIASELEISEQTIKNHMSSILRKLNANDRAHAVVLAIKRGFISIREETNSLVN